ncbi:MAG: hypothetical protein A3E81_01440 [Gammaproteobacteria bacterium RIFCSPHIGHO2_12_FULL_36_30]|nr:MAG: hypothetical protein A3E81_01440 [Gammaproteobacteria bacterium RIFCSPHIGHO2_12_FULL_36_30]
MRKITHLFLIAIIFSSAACANTYNPTQLQQFQTTGSCPGCDLTDYNYLNVNAGVETPFDLQGANLSGTTMQTVNNTLSNFSDATGIGTAFLGCYSQTNFKNAVLINAGFEYTDLTYSNFTGANVTGADFSNADLYGAKGINLSEASSVCNAILPDGSTGACS